jgi:hypothetical protein
LQPPLAAPAAPAAVSATSATPSSALLAKYSGLGGGRIGGGGYQATPGRVPAGGTPGGYPLSATTNTTAAFGRGGVYSSGVGEGGAGGGGVHGGGVGMVGYPTPLTGGGGRGMAAAAGGVSKPVVGADLPITAASNTQHSRFFAR